MRVGQGSWWELTDCRISEAENFRATACSPLSASVPAVALQAFSAISIAYDSVRVKLYYVFYVLDTNCVHLLQQKQFQNFGRTLISYQENTYLLPVYVYCCL